MTTYQSEIAHSVFACKQMGNVDEKIWRRTLFSKKRFYREKLTHHPMSLKSQIRSNFVIRNLTWPSKFCENSGWNFFLKGPRNDIFAVNIAIFWYFLVTDFTAKISSWSKEIQCMFCYFKSLQCLATRTHS